MIKILLEGRDAPLYHCTTLENAMKILNSGFIKGSYYSHKGGVSLTRNKNYWVNDESEIQFEIDQRKLSQTMKIEPYAYFNRKKGTRNYESEEVVMGDVSVKKYVTRVDIHPEVVDFYTETFNLARTSYDERGYVNIHDTTVFYSDQIEVLEFLLEVRKLKIPLGKLLLNASKPIMDIINKVES